MEQELLLAINSSEAQVPGDVVSLTRPFSAILKKERVVYSTVVQSPLQLAIFGELAMNGKEDGRECGRT
jgi:hypothetical protein